MGSRGYRGLFFYGGKMKYLIPAIMCAFLFACDSDEEDTGADTADTVEVVEDSGDSAAE